MKIRISKRDGLYIGSVGLDVENAPGRIIATAVGGTKASALAKAAGLAERIASDPVIRALVPPQAMAGIKVAKGLASAARRGPATLRRAWGFLSPKSKKLAAHLVTDIKDGAIGDVGWNPFKKKKKKKAVRKPDRELDEQPDNGDEDEGGDE